MINEKTFDFRALYAAHKVNLGLLSAFLLPLKLSWALCIIIPTILLYIFAHGRELSQQLKTLPYFLKIYALFLVWIFISSFFGLNPLRSIEGALSLAFYSLIIIFYRDLFLAVGIIKPLIAVLLGHTLSSFHSIVNTAYPSFLPKLFVGKVSESGQLAISLIMAVGLLCLLNFRLLRSSGASLNGLLVFSDILSFSRRKFYFLLLSGSALVFALSPQFSGSSAVVAGLALVFLLAIAACILFVREIFLKHGTDPFSIANFVSNLMLPLCLVALIVNLKRGPWAGVTVGCLLVVFMFSKRLIVPLMLAIAVIFLAISPVRERLELSAEHFFIHGGRKAIWDIGLELARTYPLGIGYENSPVLRDFSTEIPHELRHFHSNFLNILVETGWIGLFIFFVFLKELITCAWRLNSNKEFTILGKTIASAIVSWQIAGLVEYNFGDCEVLMISFIVMGMLAALLSEERATLGLTRNQSPGSI